MANIVSPPPLDLSGLNIDHTSPDLSPIENDFTLAALDCREAERTLSELTAEQALHVATTRRSLRETAGEHKPPTEKAMDDRIVTGGIFQKRQSEIREATFRRDTLRDALTLRRARLLRGTETEAS